MLLPYQQDVLDEKTALDKQIANLTTFTTTDIYNMLSATDKLLISDQLNYMSHYSTILGMRIARFS